MAKMDRFAEVEWRRYASAGGDKGEKQGTQFARLVMAHIDCDTIPFFWRSPHENWNPDNIASNLTFAQNRRCSILFHFDVPGG